jgi:hypothetical protein
LKPGDHRRAVLREGWRHSKLLKKMFLDERGMRQFTQHFWLLDIKGSRDSVGNRAQVFLSEFTGNNAMSVRNILLAIFSLSLPLAGSEPLTPEL